MEEEISTIIALNHYDDEVDEDDDDDYDDNDDNDDNDNYEHDYRI